MRLQEYLWQAEKLDAQIDSKILQIERLNELARKATSTLTGVPRSRGREGAALEDTITNIAALQDEINADINRLVDLQRKIVEKIRTVDNVDQRLILEYRYLCGESWASIAERLHKSERALYQLHRNILNRI